MFYNRGGDIWSIWPLNFFLVLVILVHNPGNGKQDQVEIFCTRGCWGGTYCHRNKYSKIIRRVIHSHHTRHNTTQKVNIFVTTKTFLKCKINHDFFTNKGFPKVFLWKREHSNILNIYWIYWRWIKEMLLQMMIKCISICISLSFVTTTL